MQKMKGKMMVAKGKLTKNDETIERGKRLQEEGATMN